MFRFLFFFFFFGFFLFFFFYFFFFFLFSLLLFCFLFLNFCNFRFSFLFLLLLFRNFFFLGYRFLNWKLYWFHYRSLFFRTFINICFSAFSIHTFFQFTIIVLITRFKCFNRAKLFALENFFSLFKKLLASLWSI